jgi:hypothetical protein
LVVAEEDRELVTGRFAATAVEDGRPGWSSTPGIRLMLAESHLTQRLFGSMVRRIDAPAVATR